MRITAFETFQLYFALKMHFTTKSYDYIKYHGKTKVTPDAFAKRRDRFQFQKLSRLYSAEEMKDFIIANMIENPKWVGDLITEDSKDAFLQFQYRKQSRTYLFEKEVDGLFKVAGSIKNAFHISKEEIADIPVILYRHLQGSVSYETMIILNHYFDYFPKFNDRLSDHFIGSKIMNTCIKYTPFVEFDHEKIKNILKDKVELYK